LFDGVAIAIVSVALDTYMFFIHGMHPLQYNTIHYRNIERIGIDTAAPAN